MANGEGGPVDIESKSLAQLIGNDQLVIPAYQRPYEWDDELLDGLWADIGDLYEGTNTGSHYMGVVATAKIPRDPAESISGDVDFTFLKNVWAIVDGQQRLLTLLLLLAAIRDSSPKSNASNEISSLLVVGSAKRRQPRFVGQIEDREALSAIFLAEPEARQTRSRVDATYEYFLRQLKFGRVTFFAPIKKEPTKRSTVQRIDPRKLKTLVLDRLTLSEMVLDSELQAPVVFEAINGKRRTLDATDLLRSTIFVSLNDLALFTSSWSIVEAECRAARIPGAKVGVLPLFVSSYLSSLGRKVTQDKVAVEMATLLLDVAPRSLSQSNRARRSRAFVGELSDAFQDFKLCHESRFIQDVRKPNAQIRRRLDNITMLSVGPPLPLLLLLLRFFRAKKISEAILGDCVAAIESYLARRVLAGVPQQMMRSFLTDVTAHLIAEYGNSSRFGKVSGQPNAHTSQITGALKAQLNSRVDTAPPDDSRLISLITARTSMNAVKEYQLFAILRALSDYLSHHSGLGVHPSQSPHTRYVYSVEHVFPDSFSRPERLSVGWSHDLARWNISPGRIERTISLRNAIGNLTLVNHNQHLSTRQFEDSGSKPGKKTMLSSNSLAITASITQQDKWSDRQISSRTRLLAKTAAAAFPW